MVLSMIFINAFSEKLNSFTGTWVYDAIIVTVEMFHGSNRLDILIDILIISRTAPIIKSESKEPTTWTGTIIC